MGRVHPKPLPAQKKKERSVSDTAYVEKYLENLNATLYEVEDREKAFEYSIARINPNVWYVLGAENKSRELFGEYLSLHHPALEDLFMQAGTENPPSFFGQEHSLKAVLLKKFHNNFDYGIFDVEGGNIKIRRMANKEAVNKLEKILQDMYKLQSKNSLKHLCKMESKLDKIKQRMEELTQEKLKLENVLPLDADYLQAQILLKELQKKLLYSPLWL